MDLNEDGYMDILSGSYSSDVSGGAGLFQVLWGKADGTFQKAETLHGSDGTPLVNIRDLPYDVDLDLFFAVAGTRPTAADLNGDGKLDLLVGNRLGTFYFFTGEGKGSFAPQPEQMMAGDTPLKVSGHSDPILIDWDRDGDLDIVSGSEAGGVMLSINAGSKTAPSFQAFTELIGAYDHRAMEGKFGDSHVHGPCHSTRVWVEDLNDDGKYDLLVGDTVNLVYAAEGVDESEVAEKLREWEREMEQIREEVNPLMDALFEKMDAIGDESDSDDEETIAKREALYEEFEVLSERDHPIREKRHKIVREEATGFIWVYYQK